MEVMFFGERPLSMTLVLFLRVFFWLVGCNFLNFGGNFVVGVVEGDPEHAAKLVFGCLNERTFFF